MSQLLRENSFNILRGGDVWEDFRTLTREWIEQGWLQPPYSTKWGITLKKKTVRKSFYFLLKIRFKSTIFEVLPNLTKVFCRWFHIVNVSTFLAGDHSNASTTCASVPLQIFQRGFKRCSFWISREVIEDESSANIPVSFPPAPGELRVNEKIICLWSQEGFKRKLETVG